MIVKTDDTATWVGFESAREIMLFTVALGSINSVPDEIINARIQDAAARADLDEIELVVDGIDSVSAREFAHDLIPKVLKSNRGKSSE